MTAKSDAPHEPSMDEILSNIRKMINDESDALAKDPKSEELMNNILELTEMVSEDGSVVSLKEEETSKTGPQGSPPTVEDIIMEPSPPPVVKKSTSDILSDESQRATMEAFSGLHKLQQTRNKMPEPPLKGGPIGSKTAEELMREILKPLLKEWLDANLPALVKWLVAEQIARMMQDAGFPTDNQEPQGLSPAPQVPAVRDPAPEPTGASQSAIDDLFDTPPEPKA